MRITVAALCLLFTAARGQDGYEEITDTLKNELQAVNHALYARYQKKFNIQRTNHKYLKSKLASVLQEHIEAQMDYAQEFFELTIVKAKQKKLAYLQITLNKLLRRIHLENSYLIVALAYTLQDLEREQQINSHTMIKYLSRFRKTIVFAETEVVGQIKHKFYSITPADYFWLCPAHDKLVEKNILKGDSVFSKAQAVRSHKNLKECNICFQKTSHENPLVKLRSCGDHKASYCRDCLREHITQSVKEKPVWEIPCPKQNCDGRVRSGEVLHLFSIKDATQFVNDSLEHARSVGKHFLICNEASCRLGVGIRSGSERYFVCPNCETNHCYDCGTKNPYGRNCAEHKNLSGVGDLIDLEVVQFCPNCGNGVVRMSGCQWVRCRCGYLINYLGKFREYGRVNWQTIQQDPSAHIPNQ
ncbi:MAG TPA: hypothetical protein VEL47_07610 [Myxococcota bacterium]|nr:hypothetical protein [Myxococcota bacterium]